MCVTMNFSSEPAPWMQCSAVFCNGPVLCCGLMCMAMGLRAVCVASVYPFIVHRCASFVVRVWCGASGRDF